MFVSTSRSLVITLVSFLMLFTALAYAAPLSRHGHHLTQAGSIALKRRGGSARFTYYDAGDNACGSYDSNTDYVIALSPSRFNNGAHCYKKVTVQYDGQQVQATVTDQCPGCQDAQADLSRPLFAHLAPLDEGVIYGDWWFN
ncbi:RlpA-like double-psi beta-barrel-protein domain-containing protein-containing protein [Ganoderma leucocontextum]|nr:RlpA-like double-psi beta-barrel-protein domain-containing protein-containing protein [Ganoderma leucocontextum]